MIDKKRKAMAGVLAILLATNCIGPSFASEAKDKSPQEENPILKEDENGGGPYKTIAEAKQAALKALKKYASKDSYSLWQIGDGIYYSLEKTSEEVGNEDSGKKDQGERLDFGIDTKNFESKLVGSSLKQDEALKTEALNSIKELRGKMWDENISYITDETSNKENIKLRDFLKTKGITTKEAYVNGLAWSTDLEKIAIQRMFEVKSTGMKHTRPDGSDCSTAILPNGSHSFAEILAYNSDPFTGKKAFDQWAYAKRAKYDNKSEYENLIESNGVYNNGNAHLHIILDPEFSHIGMAIINDGDINYAGVEFGYEAKSGDKATGLVGDYTMQFGKEKSDSGQKPATEITEEEREALKKAVKDSKTQIAAVNLLFETAPKKVAGVKDKLLNLIKESEDLIKQAQYYLNN